MSTDELVDPQGLEKFLAKHAAEYPGPFDVRRLGEGQSCLTFLVAGDGWEIVLRRPPRGDLPPTAFDVRREFRVMSALHAHGSPVPVPRPIALCEDHGVIGANFYLMETVDGLVVRGVLPDALSSMDDRVRMCEELVDTLVRLQAVDYLGVGLEGFGKPEGYLARQLRRMKQLWDLARFRELADIEQVGAWLEETIPAETPQPTIVHGDYKLDNVMFVPSSPARLVAVVDWEMSTIGHPLADVGWLLYFWRDPDDDPFSLSQSVTHMDGFFRRRDVLQRYASQRPVPADLNWYVALAGWKIAIIMEGSYKRFKAGIADHPAFALLEQAVPWLAARSAAAMRGEFGL